ncbi:MAG: hypothetical protein KKA07_18055 [Bacteroidetes bacterium]|nr:hypothetical protein [Bacteroidota bacterium]MBU1720975.1 hypothetical protein [Bacteroidota bacterium]
MKTNSMLFLIIASITLMVSCGKKISHEEKVKYYVTVVKELGEATIAVNEFWYETMNGMETAQRNADKKLDSATVVKLDQMFTLSTEALITAIDNLLKLAEVDEDINLKEKVLAYLNDTKKLQEASLPIIIRGLADGLDSMADQDRGTFVEFQSKGRELQKNSEDLEKLARTFLDKHNITKEDVVKEGLTQASD